MRAAHTGNIILIFCEYKNHSKENNSTIICDILHHCQENFVIEIKQISWSCPDPIFFKNIYPNPNLIQKNCKYPSGYPILILSMFTSAADMFDRLPSIIWLCNTWPTVTLQRLFGMSGPVTSVARDATFDVITSMVNGLLFHMTQPTSRSIIKAIVCSKPTIQIWCFQRFLWGWCLRYEFDVENNFHIVSNIVFLFFTVSVLVIMKAGIGTVCIHWW